MKTDVEQAVAFPSQLLLERKTNRESVWFFAPKGNARQMDGDSLHHPFQSIFLQFLVILIPLFAMARAGFKSLALN